MQLKGKVAIVTGAARGIGKGIAVKLAAEGANLALVDLPAPGETSLSYQLSDASLLKQTAREIESLGVKVVPVLADVTKAADTHRMVAETVSVLGGIDILVNNAGVITMSTVMETTEAQWDKTMEVNVKGIFLCCQAAISELAKRGEGRIVNIASVAGKTGRAGVAAYCASKFDHTQVFDRFVGQNTYLRREQTPADIGECVVYLCKADNVTGESINVAGGGDVH